MFEFIGRFLRSLWRVSNFWRIPPFEHATAGVRVGSSLAARLMFIFLLFLFIAIALVVAGSLFGFTVEETLGGVDGLIARVAPTMDLVGSFLLQRVLMGLILLLCVFGGVALLVGQFTGRAPERLGWLKTIPLLLVCLVFGYCSAVNVMAPLDPYNPDVGSRYMD